MTEDQDFLLRSLTDLDAEFAAGDIELDDYTALRDSYVARAAAALRDLPPPDVSPEPVTVSSRDKRVTNRGGTVLVPILVSGAVVVFAVLAAVLLSHNAGTRLPGQNVSGGGGPASPIGRLNAQAQDLIQKSDVLGAIKTYDAVLKLDPRNAEALAYKGWLLRLAGSQSKNTQLIDTGLASIREAEAAAPGYPDAHFFAGETLLRDKGDAQGAIAEFEQFLADNPPAGMVAEVRLEEQSAQQLLGSTSSTSTAPTSVP